MTLFERVTFTDFKMGELSKVLLSANRLLRRCGFKSHIVHRALVYQSDD